MRGTTLEGGNTVPGVISQGGTVFELTPSQGGGWTETVLYSFCLPDDCGFRGYPYAGLIMDAAGNLYGATSFNGKNGAGTVFELTPNQGGGWTETVLYNFCSQANCADGANPYASLIIDGAGNRYGTTASGGTSSSSICPSGCGTVFELTPNSAHTAWTETVLYTFCAGGGSCADGAHPFDFGGLLMNSAGNLYGTTDGFSYGGAVLGGTAFELAPKQGGGWTKSFSTIFARRPIAPMAQNRAPD